MKIYFFTASALPHWVLKYTHWTKDIKQNKILI